MTGFPAEGLRPGEIHLWMVELEDPCQVNPGWEQVLSAEEVERSQRYRFEKDRLRFISRRAILRRLLGAYTGTNPASIRYSTSPHGKLSLASRSLSFNLSKSQDRIVYTFAPGDEVGVDVEHVHPLQDLDRLAARWFSLQEQADMLALVPEWQADAFYHVWTQKEAFIKAQGEGLNWQLKDFSVCVDPNQPARLMSIKGDPAEASHWKMAGKASKDGWRVAVCLHSHADPLVCWFTPPLDDLR